MSKKAGLLYRYIGSKIKAKRVSLGLSQSNLGKILDVSFQQIQKYETGLNRIPVSSLFVLSKAFSVSIDYFFEDFNRKLLSKKKREVIYKINKDFLNLKVINYRDEIAKKIEKIKNKTDKETILRIIRYLTREA